VHGGKVTIDVDEGDQVVLRFVAPEPAAPPAAAEPVA
jgi:hypothetical protein